MTLFLTLNHLQSLPTLSIRMLQWQGWGWGAGIFAQRGVLTTLMVSLPGFIFSSLVLSNNRRDPLSLKEQTNSSSTAPGSMATEQTSITARFYLLRALTWHLVPWHGGALLHPQPQHAFLPPPVLQERCPANTGKGVKKVVGRSQKN